MKSQKWVKLQGRRAGERNRRGYEREREKMCILCAWEGGRKRERRKRYLQNNRTMTTEPSKNCHQMPNQVLKENINLHCPCRLPLTYRVSFHT